MSNRRLFIGIEVQLAGDQAVEGAIKKINISAKKKNTAIKWVPNENHHITVFFLGDLNAKRLPEIIEKTKTICEKFSPFNLKLTGVDAFPSQRASRVLFIGVQSKKVLHELHQEFNDAFSEFNDEDREYKPHLTIGRIKNACSTKDMISPFQRKSFGKVTINRVYIYESHLANYNPIYQKLEGFALSKVEEDDSEFN